MNAEHVEYATIAATGTVSYTGTKNGNRFDHYTYDQPSEFDWSRLRGDVPVIDCRSVLYADLCRVSILGPVTHGSEHIEKYRAAGVDVRNACYWRTTYMEGAYTR